MPEVADILIRCDNDAKEPARTVAVIEEYVMRSRVIDPQPMPGPEMPERRPEIYQQAFQRPTPAYQNNGSYAAYHHPITPPSSANAQPAHAPLAPAEGWLALFLLGIALYCVVGSVIAAGWVENSTLLLWPPVIGLQVGFLIAKVPRFPQSILHLAACLVGHWLAIWLTSQFAFHQPWMQILVDLRSALEGNMASMDAQAGQAVFFFYLAFLCFFLGYFGSWLIYRARLPWLVVLVYCSIILVNLNYVNGLAISLSLTAIMAGALLLLVARLHLVSQISFWRQEGLYTDQTWIRSITRRCMQIACVITLCALLFSQALPVFAQPDSGRAFWDRATTAWNDLLSGHFSLDDLTALSPFSSSSGPNFFNDHLTITGSVTLPQGEVLSYQSMADSAQANPYYLEGFTFNRFDGHTWTSTATATSTFAPNQSLLPDQNATGQVKITMTLPPGGPKNYIFGPDQPATFSRSVTTYSDAATAAWTTSSSLKQGESYTVSFVAPPSVNDLLASLPLPGDEPGLWQADRSYNLLQATYLAVPNDLSPKVQQALNDWTQGAAGAYQAMQAIEEHFNNSNQFSYSLSNPPVPANTDVVDWLLKNKQGYCTHYATAMAIMGRMLGIPTRMVNGFSQGHFDAQRNAWIVDGTDAHSWVQAYFPSAGWVSFDPTPGYAQSAAPTPATANAQASATTQPQPTPTQPPAKTATPQPQKPADPSQGSSGAGMSGGNLALWVMISIGALLFSLLLCLLAFACYWWRRLYADSTFVSGLFWRFCKLASLAGLAPRSWQTPYEYSWDLSRRFPDQAGPLWHLTELFVRDRWGAPQHLPREREQADARQHWHALRGLYWRLLTSRVRRKS